MVCPYVPLLNQVGSVELKRGVARHQHTIRISADRSAVRQKKQDRFIPVFTNTVVWVVISVTRVDYYRNSRYLVWFNRKKRAALL